jgi:hypothetical protein
MVLTPFFRIIAHDFRKINTELTKIEKIFRKRLDNVSKMFYNIENHPILVNE